MTLETLEEDDVIALLSSVTSGERGFWKQPKNGNVHAFLLDTPALR